MIAVISIKNQHTFYKSFKQIADKLASIRVKIEKIEPETWRMKYLIQARA